MTDPNDLYIQGYSKGYTDGYDDAVLNIRKRLLGESVTPDNTDYRTSDDPRKERDDMAPRHPQLRRELEDTLNEVNKQINEVKTLAQSREMRPEEMQYRDGKYIMAELLVAKASALNALASL